MRTKYGEYPEYHTSLDNLDLVTAKGLAGGYEFVQSCIKSIEENSVYCVTNLCEPQLGKRGLYPNTSKRGSGRSVRNITNVLAYADGRNDLIDISNIIKVPISEIVEIVEDLRDVGLLKESVRLKENDKSVDG